MAAQDVDRLVNLAEQLVPAARRGKPVSGLAEVGGNKAFERIADVDVDIDIDTF